MFRPSCGHLQAVFVYEEVNVIDLYMHVGIAIRLHMNLCLGLLPKIVGTTERERDCWRQFGAICLKLQLSTCNMSVLVVAQSSSEVPEGLMNDPVYQNHSFIRRPFY